MSKTVQLVVCGILPLTANGTLEILKEPPFSILTPGWAVRVVFDLEQDVPHISRVFDFMHACRLHSGDIMAGQDDTWVAGDWHCIGREPLKYGTRYTLVAARYERIRSLRVGDVRTRRLAA